MSFGAGDRHRIRRSAAGSTWVPATADSEPVPYYLAFKMRAALA